VKYRIVNLGTDYDGRITDFSEARNFFLDHNDWVLFIDSDEEASQLLLKHLDHMIPHFPYYWIRRINFADGKYLESWNPDYQPRLVSNRVRFIGRVHERVVPRDPHGSICRPILHNHIGPVTYGNYWYQRLPVWKLALAVKKSLQVVTNQ